VTACFTIVTVHFKNIVTGDFTKIVTEIG